MEAGRYCEHLLTVDPQNHEDQHLRETRGSSAETPDSRRPIGDRKGAGPIWWAAVSDGLWSRQNKLGQRLPNRPVPDQFHFQERESAVLPSFPSSSRERENVSDKDLLYRIIIVYNYIFVKSQNMQAEANPLK